MSGGEYNYIHEKDISHHVQSNNEFAQMRGLLQHKAEKIRQIQEDGDKYQGNKYRGHSDTTPTILKLIALEINEYWHSLENIHGKIKNGLNETPEDLQLWHKEISSLLKDIEWHHSGDTTTSTLVEKFTEYVHNKTPRKCQTCGEKLSLLDCQPEQEDQPFMIPQRETYCSDKCRTASNL